MTPLQQKHLDAIENDINVGSFEEVEDIKRASLQCTRITIEEKIELLDKLIHHNAIQGVAFDAVKNLKTELTNELKQL